MSKGQIDTRKGRVYHRTATRKAKVKEYNASPRGRYQAQKCNAQNRGIDFVITFDEWWSEWEEKWDERGRGRGKYHMCRYGDTGPYSVGNVYIAKHEQNVLDKARMIGKQGNKLPESAIDEIMELRVKNHSVREIAKIIGCTNGCVCRYLRVIG